MPAVHEIRITDPYGQRLDVFGHGEWLWFETVRVANRVGSGKFGLPYTDRWETLYQPDNRISILTTVDDGPQLVLNDTVFLIAGQLELDDTPGGQSITLPCPDLMDILDDRGIPHRSKSPEAQKTGPADDVIKALMRENVASTAADAFGPLAARGIPASILEIEGDRSQAPTIDIACAWRTDLLRVLQDCASTSREKGTYLAFDMIARPDRPILFQTFTQQRGRDQRQIVLSRQRGTLAKLRYTIDYSKAITAVYAAGRGEDEDRVAVLVANSVALRRSPLAWRERIINPSSTMSSDPTIDQTPILEAAAQAELDSATLRPAFVADFAQTGAIQYHKDLFFGDRVTAEGFGKSIECRLDAVIVSANPEGDQVKAIIQQDEAL